MKGNLFLTWLCFAFAAAPAWTVQAAPPLTLERLFADPPLVGNLPHALQYAPDGETIGFVKAATNGRDQAELWVMDVKSGEQRRVFSMAEILQSGEVRTRAVAAALEQNPDSIELTDFRWSPDGSAVLLTLAGDLFVYQLEDPELTAITDTRNAEKAARFAPGNRYLSFVRDGDLYLHDIVTGRERRLTRTGRDEGPVRNGLPDYIASEEMKRTSSYWWSPGARYLAFMETDETGIRTTPRIALGPGGFSRLTPAFPRAGEDNVRNRLGILTTGSGRIRWAKLPGEGYIARVQWLPDASGLLVVHQSRDQKRLDVLRLDRKGRVKQVLIRETSASWIDLHHDFYISPDGTRFTWASERDGPRTIYLYDLEGNNLGPLTSDLGDIDEVADVDWKNNRLFVEGWDETPLEKHLYVTDLDPGTATPPMRITMEGAWHKAVLSPDNATFVDVETNPAGLPTVALRSLDNTLLHWIAENRLTKDHPYAPYAEDHVAPTFGTLKAVDGTTLHYRYVRPPGDGPFPVIVHVYGGPKGQLVRKSWMPLWYQVAVAKGYAVFSLDNRGTARRGHGFEQGLTGRLGKIEVADQMLGLDWLGRQSFADPARIGVYGWSYGGYMALKMVLTAPDKLAAAVAGAPVTDWRLYDTHYTERYLGLPSENEAAYDASDIFPEIAGLSRPLLLIHGLADGNVSVENSVRAMSVLQKNAVPFETMVYPGAGHSIRKDGPERHLYETMFRFWDRTLNGKD